MTDLAYLSISEAAKLLRTHFTRTAELVRARLEK